MLTTTTEPSSPAEDAELVGALLAEPPDAQPAPDERSIACSVCGHRYIGGQYGCCPRYLLHPAIAAVIRKRRTR